MKIDLIELEKDIKEGWINFQTHPTLPLRILKYSPQTAYSGEWTPLRRKTRGLVIDSEGNVVVNCMEKFFNSSEPEGAKVLKENEDRIKYGYYEISHKEDGSLIQAAFWRGELIITSSGSFTSPQAIKAAELIDKLKYKELMSKDATYIFEIIYPSNRIVLNYGDKESLVLLALRHTDTGEEWNITKILPGFELVKIVPKGLDLIYFLAQIETEKFINKEGYVVKFLNTDGSCQRVKLKYKEYVKLHKIISNLSEKSIWETLKSGGDPEKDLEGIPDEMFRFVKETCKSLKLRYAEIENLIPEAMKNVEKLETRKEKAKLIMDSYMYIRGVLFSALDKKDYSKIIWDMCEPANGKIMGRGENI